MKKKRKKKVKRLKIDIMLEFYSNEFNVLYANKGIAPHKIVRHTPQQNSMTK